MSIWTHPLEWDSTASPDYLEPSMYENPSYGAVLWLTMDLEKDAQYNLDAMLELLWKTTNSSLKMDHRVLSGIIRIGKFADPKGSNNLNFVVDANRVSNYSFG